MNIGHRWHFQKTEPQTVAYWVRNTACIVATNNDLPNNNRFGFLRNVVRVWTLNLVTSTRAVTHHDMVTVSTAGFGDQELSWKQTVASE
jgi:hypothetical protein